MNDDGQLLQEYAATRSDSAYGQLVKRYVDFVYASARRQLGDSHLAEDVTQAVFIVLAQKASSIPKDRPISNWLLKVTTYCAANARRARARRNNHERRAAEMAPTTSDDEKSNPLAQMLDEGLITLPRADRDVLLLKFFEQKSIHEVSDVLGVSQDAAQKRVARAIEKLRDYFRAKGAATLSAAELGILLASESIKTAPQGLAGSIAASGAAGAGAGGAVAKGALIFMTMQKLKIGAIVALVLILGAAGAFFIWPKSPALPVQASRHATATWPMVFSDGTSVEVIALCDPQQPSRWWGADGVDADDPKFRANGTITLNYPAARRLDVIVRMVGSSLNQKGISIRTDSPYRTAMLPAGDVNQRFVKFIVPVARGAASGNIRIGVAAGPWGDELRLSCANGESPPTGSTGAGVSFMDVAEDKDKDYTRVRLRVLSEAAGGAVGQREVTLTAGKQELRPMTSTSVADVYSYVFKCPRSEAANITIRSRPYEWIEMKHVAFQPTSEPTKVEVGQAAPL